MSIQKVVMGKVSMGLLKVRKYAPEILTAGALVSGGASLALAVKQTLTVSGCFEPWTSLKERVENYDRLVKEQTEEWEKRKDEPGFPDLPEDTYTEEKRQKDRLVSGAQTALNLLQHYALPLALAGISGACVLGLYKVWKARYTAVVAAYTGLQGLFEKYRDVVKEKYGEEADKEATALAVDKSVETLEESALGKKRRVSRGGSPYARFFDESSIYFKRTAGENLSFLQRNQAVANQMLKFNGSLFLNEVYDMLGFPRTKAGSVVGWIHTPGKDHEVDFGYWDLDDERKRAFINGWENCVLLDFNVDGVIFDMI